MRSWESIRSRTCDIFSFHLIEVLIRGTFCRKPHLNRSSGSEVIAIERFSKQQKTKEMHSFFWLYLTINASDFRLISLDHKHIFLKVPVLIHTLIPELFFPYGDFGYQKLSYIYFLCINPLIFWLIYIISLGIQFAFAIFYWQIHLTYDCVMQTC